MSILKNADFSAWGSATMHAVAPYAETARHWRLAYGDDGVRVADAYKAPNGIGIDVIEPGDGTGWFGLEQTMPGKDIAGKKARLAFGVRASSPVNIGIGIGPVWRAPAYVVGWDRADPAPVEREFEFPDTLPEQVALKIMLPTTGRYGVQLTPLTLDFV